MRHNTPIWNSQRDGGASLGFGQAVARKGHQIGAGEVLVGQA